LVTSPEFSAYLFQVSISNKVGIVMNHGCEVLLRLSFLNYSDIGVRLDADNAPLPWLHEEAKRAAEGGFTYNT
jgi:hypothetical protein